MISKINCINPSKRLVSFKAKHMPKHLVLPQQSPSDSRTFFSPTLESILLPTKLSKRLHLLKPIQSKYEYLKALDEINNYSIPNMNNNQKYINFFGYQLTEPELRGIIPYCGVDDISGDINCWLSGRDFENEEYVLDSMMSKIICVLDYSLARLDDKIGKYKGMVYRVGYFNPNKDKQYYSASSDIDCPIELSGFTKPNKDEKYSIIKLNNGHKINKFQRYANSNESRAFEKTEQEILIDRKSRFIKLSPKDFSRAQVDDILKILATTHDLDLSRANLKGLYEKAIDEDLISVWEEV